MCEYLLAAFSLKRSVDEGLTHEQLAAVERRRSTILTVARQEMLHLAIACNRLTSIGVSLHLSRPKLPQPARHCPSGLRLELLLFGEQALRHFLFLERRSACRPRSRRTPRRGDPQLLATLMSLLDKPDENLAIVSP